MDPTMQQFFEAQMQLIQKLNQHCLEHAGLVESATTTSSQPPSDKHKEFKSHCPPTFSHSTDPLDADDWMKVVTMKLEMVQCNDR
jgi:hypothetical protein